ncbi:hypothetical protein BaRGS_00011382 [Batillaria attramentaria]|uniref:Uncharacterized protein n=1 Tax=Batillaria attramentaria TaxID=370345 RepID=A0ABD0LDD4_9CAEN
MTGETQAATTVHDPVRAKINPSSLHFSPCLQIARCWEPTGKVSGGGDIPTPRVKEGVARRCGDSFPGQNSLPDVCATQAVCPSPSGGAGTVGRAESVNPRAPPGHALEAVLLPTLVGLPT